MIIKITLGTTRKKIKILSSETLNIHAMKLKSTNKGVAVWYHFAIVIGLQQNKKIYVVRKLPLMSQS